MSRRMTASLINTVRNYNATTLLTSELPEKTEFLSSDGISEFLCDGVILLYFWEFGQVEERTLKIRKMRYTSHEKGPMLYSMEKSGIVVKKEGLV